MKKSEIEIVTISKAKFNNMSSAQKRVAVARDVVDRIKLKQFTGLQGDMFHLKNNHEGLCELRARDESISEFLKKPNIQCEVCAKGGLFMAYIGIKNELSFSGFSSATEADSYEMKELSKIFSPHQLALIETAFEGTYFEWNVDISRQEKNDCISFYKNNKSRENKFSSGNDSGLLIAICKNIIKNKGTFKP